MLPEHCSASLCSLEDGWGSPGHVFSECHSTVHKKASAFAFSGESAESRSDRRAETEQRLTLFALPYLLWLLSIYTSVCH